MQPRSEQEPPKISTRHSSGILAVSIKVSLCLLLFLILETAIQCRDLKDGNEHLDRQSICQRQLIRNGIDVLYWPPQRDDTSRLILFVGFQCVANALRRHFANAASAHPMLPCSLSQFDHSLGRARFISPLHHIVTVSNVQQKKALSISITLPTGWEDKIDAILLTTPCCLCEPFDSQSGLVTVVY